MTKKTVRPRIRMPFPLSGGTYTVAGGALKADAKPTADETTAIAASEQATSATTDHAAADSRRSTRNKE